jgi:5-methyltetrahydropteroyltriglutamate--homocysteine methyltransferase
VQTSTDRILVTHTGSLPRPADLDQLLFAREEGDTVSPEAFAEQLQRASADVVAAQLEAGVDVVNDGELGKIGYSTYVKERLTGFEGNSEPVRSAEMIEFPTVFAAVFDTPGFQHMKLPACNGPVSLADPDAVGEDISGLRTAVGDRDVAELFMSAASPGVIATFLRNEHYASHEEYLFALADAMKPEYDAIAAAGIVLQLDCPDLAMTRQMGSNADLSDEQFLDQIRLHVRALNHAVRDISPEQLRLHVCWGNYAGPHIYDIPMRDIVDIVLTARPSGLAFEAANPRHEHEWAVWRDVRLPEDKVLIPGVLDTTSNYVEHPELVAQRIVRFAELVGRERVIAGTDCGFGTFAGYYTVDPSVVWLKLRAMAEGARLASEQLWR